MTIMVDYLHCHHLQYLIIFNHHRPLHIRQHLIILSHRHHDNLHEHLTIFLYLRNYLTILHRQKQNHHYSVDKQWQWQDHQKKK